MIKKSKSRVKKLAAPALSVERHIHVLRGQKTMLDSDLAMLYGVTTGNLNLAVRRNQTRFPTDFMFPLNRSEADSLLLQFAIAKSGRGGRKTLPFAFTELGVAMLSSVLKSERAVQMDMSIMRAFVQMRNAIAHNRSIAVRMEKLERGQERVGSVIEILAEDIDRIAGDVRQMKALPLPRKRKIGF